MIDPYANNHILLPDSTSEHVYIIKTVITEKGFRKNVKSAFLAQNSLGTRFYHRTKKDINQETVKRYQPGNTTSDGLLKHFPFNNEDALPIEWKRPE